MEELEAAYDDASLDGAPIRRSIASPAAVIDRITMRDRTINALEAEQLTEMLEFVENARSEARTHATSIEKVTTEVAVHDLSLAVGVSPGVLSARLARARRVRGRFPRVWNAYYLGSVSSWHIAKIDAQLLRITRPETTVELDEPLATYAASHTPVQTHRWLAREIEKLESDASNARHRRARADRHIRISDAGDGMSWLTALLPALDAAAIAQRLDQEARSTPATDPRTHDQAAADTLVGLLLTDVEPGTGQRTHVPVRTVIGITVPVTSLMGLTNTPGELADGSISLPAAMIRDHALRPGTLFYRLLTDPHGHLLDATRLGRFAPDAIRPPLWFRDRTTTFPTSTVPAERCDVDHVEAWPAPTHGENLQSLHRRAHRFKTAGYYTIRRRGSSWEWTTRTGHVYTHQPDLLPVEHWPEPMAPAHAGSG